MFEIDFPNLIKLNKIVQNAYEIANTSIDNKFCIMIDEINAWIDCELLEVNLKDGYVKVYYDDKQSIISIEEFMEKAKTYAF